MEERCGVVFQAQRVTGHEATSAATIPPTALSEDEEDVLSLSFYMLCY